MKYVSIYKIAQYGTFFVFSMLLGYIIYESLTDWYLWYDEAGQFYISKGLHHNSKPFTSYLGVANVIYNNRYFNLDPGGFSVLLNYWSMGSNHYAYLRLLPLLFFLAFIFVAYKIGIQLFHTHFPAILLAISLCIIFIMYKQDRFSAKTILPIIAYSCITLMGGTCIFCISDISKCDSKTSFVRAIFGTRFSGNNSL